MKSFVCKHALILSYHVETGGKLKNLRESTTIEKVREYHKSYYRPENLYLIITGNIGSEDILSALEPVEEKILRKRSRGETPLPLEKPFQRDLPKLEENVTQTFQYPAEDLLFGKVRALRENTTTIKPLTTGRRSKPFSIQNSHLFEPVASRCT